LGFAALSANLQKRLSQVGLIPDLLREKPNTIGVGPTIAPVTVPAKIHNPAP
jgi:hypothetical protein